MWGVIGLGNPGEKYAGTRHNVGYMVIDALAERFKISLTEKRVHYLFGRGFIEAHEVVLVKPLTFMNRSGIVVREMLSDFDDIENLLIVHDDLDMEPGLIRIREKGSAGGHRGVQSVIDHLHSKEFPRLKIGIGRSHRISAEAYVLKPFNRQQRRVIEEAIEVSVDAITSILIEGVRYAQNRFHGL